MRERQSTRNRRGAAEWRRERVGLTYHSPHKFRHGHAVYALRLAKDVATLKAVSQNLMHENLAVTDGVYGVLSDTDVKRQISELGKGQTRSESREVGELVSLTRELLNKLEADARAKGRIV